MIGKIVVADRSTCLLREDFTWISDNLMLADAVNRVWNMEREQYSPADGDPIISTFNRVVKIIEPTQSELTYNPPPLDPNVVY